MQNSWSVKLIPTSKLEPSPDNMQKQQLAWHTGKQAVDECEYAISECNVQQEMATLRLKCVYFSLNATIRAD